MNSKFTLPILTVGHFVVDLACLFFYFANFPQGGFITGIAAAVLYNFLAFALQAPIGYFFDRFPAKRSTSIGILLVVCGYTCGFFTFSHVGLIFCAIGNAFYHVGGSIGIARIDKKGLRDSGIFVSAGALGVSLGTYLASGQALFISFRQPKTALLLLLLVSILIMQLWVDSPKRKNTATLSEDTNAALLLLSLFAVFIRSLGGFFFPTAYKALFALPEDTPYALFLLAMASGIVAFLGKFLGGFFSWLCTGLLHKLFPKKRIDLRHGNYIFGTFTLLLSAVFLTLGSKMPVLQFLNPNSKPILCFLGILLFHAAMPVTLFELYCILPDRPGFAMGLSTLMLFLGYLPYAFFPLEKLPAPAILLLLTLLAAGCMLLSLRIYCKESVKEELKP